MFWVGNQGEGTSPCCTLFFSDFRTSFSFSLWLGGWDHFTRRTETFQKISNMYGYLFVHITLHGFFSEFSVVRGGGNDETVSTGCGSPSVLHPWMLLLHMQETALWIPPVCCVLDDICKRQLCGFVYFRKPASVLATANIRHLLSVLGCRDGLIPFSDGERRLIRLNSGTSTPLTLI